MKLFFADTVPLGLPEGHRFPAVKYPLLRERVARSGCFPPEALIPASPVSFDLLCLAHTPDYVRRVFSGQLSEKEIRRIGLPWSPELVERSRCSVGATLSACRAALSEGVSANLGGGTHHAYADHGEGYCVFNDVAVAVRAILSETPARRILIVDCDVHQGNGTAAILAGDPAVFILDLYGARNFPFHKEAVSLAVPLPDGANDAVYLAALRTALPQAIEQAQADLAIYLAGSDAFAGDSLGRLSLTKAGLEGRDRLVLHSLRQAGLGVCVVMAGGYARPISDTVDIHFRTLCVAQEVFGDHLR